MNKRINRRCRIKPLTVEIQNHHSRRSQLFKRRNLIIKIRKVISNRIKINHNICVYFFQSSISRVKFHP